MVALSMFDLTKSVDHDKTKIYVNDIDLTDQADLSEEIISLVPGANLASGRTKIKSNYMTSLVIKFRRLNGSHLLEI